jgi:hypothetical protein
MGNVVNLRKARKQAKRQEDEARAAANRLKHGRSKAERLLEANRFERGRRELEAHRIDTGDAS